MILRRILKRVSERACMGMHGRVVYMGALKIDAWLGWECGL
jgi:hypothetical protein